MPHGSGDARTFNDRERAPPPCVNLARLVQEYVVMTTNIRRRGTRKPCDPQRLTPGEREILARAAKNEAGTTYIEGSTRNQIGQRLAAANLGHMSVAMLGEIGGVFQINDAGRQALSHGQVAS